MATPAAILKTFRRVVPSVSISLMISLFSMFVSPLKMGMKPFVSTRYQILIERNSQTVSP
jgi:hypothetical protein